MFLTIAVIVALIECPETNAVPRTKHRKPVLDLG